MIPAKKKLIEKYPMVNMTVRALRIISDRFTMKNSSWIPGYSPQGVLWYGNRAKQTKRRLGRTQQN